MKKKRTVLYINAECKIIDEMESKRTYIYTRQAIYQTIYNHNDHIQHPSVFSSTVSLSVPHLPSSPAP